MTGWAGFPDLFNDSAFYQGDFWSPPESSGVIVNTARCNQGSYQETTWGAKQLANVRAQGKDTGHYLFNGNLNKYTVGRLWAATCRRNGFNPATEVLAYDCEDEGSTGTVAWGPVDVIECQRGFNDEWGSPIPWQSIRIYMNLDVNGRYNWAPLVKLGAQLWFARPGGPLDQSWWPTVWAKQDGTFQGVDANGYTKTFAASNGVQPTAMNQEEDGMFVFSTLDAAHPGMAFVLADRRITYLGSQDALNAALAGLYNSIDPSNIRQLDDNGIIGALSAYGLSEYSIQEVVDLWKTAPFELIASSADARKAPTATVTLTDGDADKIAAKVDEKLDIPKTFQIDTIPGKAVAA